MKVILKICESTFDKMFLKGATVFPRCGVRVLDFIEERDKLNEMLGVKE